MKIYVKALAGIVLPKIIDKGDWIDLICMDDTVIHGPKVDSDGKVVFDSAFINLGVAMKLPDGYEAIVAPRSSLFKKKHIILVNSIGIIDNSYQGNNDFWRFNALGFDYSSICKGERIAQFRIQLSQKATVIQKLKWLFSNKIEIIQVDKLPGKNRGGIGSTGGMK